MTYQLDRGGGEVGTPEDHDVTIIHIVISQSVTVESESKAIEFATVADPSICRVSQHAARAISISGIREGVTDVVLWHADESTRRILARVVPENGLPSDPEIAALEQLIRDNFAVFNFRLLRNDATQKIHAQGQVDFDHRIAVGRTLEAKIASASLVDEGLVLRFPADKLSRLVDFINETERPNIIDPLTIEPVALETGRVVVRGTVHREDSGGNSVNDRIRGYLSANGIGQNVRDYLVVVVDG
ncbi:MAG: pilus assembly protein N-terminal domain-containing protein [Isosphaeraceae bacterium]